MNEVEEIIKKIIDADECEIMEFDFDPCFQLMRDMEARIAELEKKIQEAMSCLICEPIADPSELCVTSYEILDSALKTPTINTEE